MSIAGLGASLGSPAQAKSDTGAHARLVAVLGLPDRAAQKGLETAAVQERNFPFAVWEPIGHTRDANELQPVFVEDALLRDTREQMTASAAAAPLDNANSAAPKPASTHDATTNLTAVSVAWVPVGTAPNRKDPAPRWIVNGIRVREPKGPSVSAKPWESISAAGHGSARSPSGGAEATPPGASLSGMAEEAGFAASSDETGFATSTDELQAYFALHCQPATPQDDLRVEKPLAIIDIDLDAITGVETTTGTAAREVNLTRGVLHRSEWDADSTNGFEAPMDLTPALAHEPGSVANLVPDLGSSATLDLDGYAFANAVLDLNLELGPELDLNLGAVSEPHSGSGVGLPAALSLTTASLPALGASVYAIPGHPFVASDNTASCTSGLEAADKESEIFLGRHASTIMRSLGVVLSKAGSASRQFAEPAEEIFVARHVDKVLLNLASVLGRSDPAPRLAAETLFEEPLAVAASERLTAQSNAITAPAAVEQPLAMTAGSVSTPEAPEQAGRAAFATMGELVALGENTLAEVRGGYQTDTGLQMSFGIERAIYINGSLVTTTSLNIAAKGGAIGVQPAPSAVSADSGNLTLIQNGAGNTFTAGSMSPATLGTLVQNTLNDQKIQGVTMINATVNSLQILKSQSFESSLRGAIVDSLRR